MRLVSYLLPAALMISGCAQRVSNIAPYEIGEYELSRKAMEVTGNRDPTSIFYFSSRPISKEPDYAIAVPAFFEIRRRKAGLSRKLLGQIDANGDRVVTEEEASDFFSDKR
ncbi:MAG: hypothetical protein HYT73_01055 [Candidatus Aenigmarchaeota archaeon]|nr:hypothetical protein [Candidatus Aenigmarchaeota archaeon]